MEVPPYYPDHPKTRKIWARYLDSMSVADRLERKYVFGGRGRGDETEFSIRTVRTNNYRYIRNEHPERPFLQRNWYKEASYPTIDLMRKLYFEDKLNDLHERLLAPDRPAEELYYIPEEPHEVHNLMDSSKPAHQRAKHRLRAVLDTWRLTTNDQGRFHNDPGREQAQKTFDRGWNEFKDNYPERYRRYRKMLEHWRDIDDDRANTSHRK